MIMTTERKRRNFIFLVAVLLSPIFIAAQSQQPQADPKLTEVWEPVPRAVTPGIGTAPPSDAIVLFNGKDLSQWQQTDGSPAKWKVAGGAVTVVKSTGNIQTKRAFGDCQLHIEWRTPEKSKAKDKSEATAECFFRDTTRFKSSTRTTIALTRMDKRRAFTSNTSRW